MVVFGDARKQKDITLNIGDIIRVQPSMKYVGIYIDSQWNMKTHFNYILEKEMVKSLGRLMPNLGYPREERRLFSNVLYSVLLERLYGLKNWGKQRYEFMKELYELKKIQKRIAIRVVAAYRSVAIHSALISARILPMELQADLPQKIYLEKKKRMSEGVDLEVEITHSRLLTKTMR